MRPLAGKRCDDHHLAVEKTLKWMLFLFQLIFLCACKLTFPDLG